MAAGSASVFTFAILVVARRRPREALEDGFFVLLRVVVRAAEGVRGGVGACAGPRGSRHFEYGVTSEGVGGVLACAPGAAGVGALNLGRFLSCASKVSRAAPEPRAGAQFSTPVRALGRLRRLV